MNKSKNFSTAPIPQYGSINSMDVGQPKRKSWHPINRGFEYDFDRNSIRLNDIKSNDGSDEEDQAPISPKRDVDENAQIPVLPKLPEEQAPLLPKHENKNPQEKPAPFKPRPLSTDEKHTASQHLDALHQTVCADLLHSAFANNKIPLTQDPESKALKFEEKDIENFRNALEAALKPATGYQFSVPSAQQIAKALYYPFAGTMTLSMAAIFSRLSFLSGGKLAADMIPEALLSQDNAQTVGQWFFSSVSFLQNLFFMWKNLSYLPETAAEIGRDIVGGDKMQAMMKAALFLACVGLIGYPSAYLYNTLSAQADVVDVLFQIFPQDSAWASTPQAWMAQVLSYAPYLYGFSTRTVGAYRILSGVGQSLVDGYGWLKQKVQWRALGPDEQAFYHFKTHLKAYQYHPALDGLRYDEKSPTAFIHTFYEKLSDAGIFPFQDNRYWQTYVKPTGVKAIQAMLTGGIVTVMWALFKNNAGGGIRGNLGAIGNCFMFSYTAKNLLPTVETLVKKYLHNAKGWTGWQQGASVVIALITGILILTSGAGWQSSARDATQEDGLSESFGFGGVVPILVNIAAMILNGQTLLAYAESQLAEIFIDAGKQIQAVEAQIKKDIARAEKTGKVPNQKRLDSSPDEVKANFSNMKKDIITHIVAERSAELMPTLRKLFGLPKPNANQDAKENLSTNFAAFFGTRASESISAKTKSIDWVIEALKKGDHESVIKPDSLFGATALREIVTAQNTSKETQYKFTENKV